MSHWHTSALVLPGSAAWYWVVVIWDDEAILQVAHWNGDKWSMRGVESWYDIPVDHPAGVEGELEFVKKKIENIANWQISKGSRSGVNK